MDLNDLNKQQLILLALLVSFITSIATGIVTVTLMDQAPPGVTQTINRVVEKTVQVIAPPGSSENKNQIVTETVVVKEEDYIVDAAQKNKGNVIRVGTLSQQEGFRIGSIELTGSSAEAVFKSSGGSGFVVTQGGLFVTDKELVKGDRRYGAQTVDGHVYEARVLIVGDRLALLDMTFPEETGTSTSSELQFARIVPADPHEVKLGQTTVALGINDAVSLHLGVVSRIEKATQDVKETIKTFYTTMTASVLYSGGPLLNTSAEVIGINIVPSQGEPYTVPSSEIKELLDKHLVQIDEENSESVQE